MAPLLPLPMEPGYAIAKPLVLLPSKMVQFMDTSELGVVYYIIGSFKNGPEFGYGSTVEGPVDILLSHFRYVSNNKYRLVKEFSVDQTQTITAMSAINSFFSCILPP